MILEKAVDHGVHGEHGVKTIRTGSRLPFLRALRGFELRF
jgi:hypothetical protein